MTVTASTCSGSRPAAARRKPTSPWPRSRFSLRRLSDADRRECGGVDVLMRYTLRLLTVQQFQRAASLICACDAIRRETGDLGDAPISLGLYVGDQATPNRARDALEALQEEHQGLQPRSTPRQLLGCPVCGHKLPPSSYTAAADGSGINIRCEQLDCEAAGEAIPVDTVDDYIYASPPSLIIGTIDKFAQLPRRSDLRTLFGLDGGLRPGLIIQDELHLISGSARLDSGAVRDRHRPRLHRGQRSSQGDRVHGRPSGRRAVRYARCSTGKCCSSPLRGSRQGTPSSPSATKKGPGPGVSWIVVCGSKPEVRAAGGHGGAASGCRAPQGRWSTGRFARSFLDRHPLFQQSPRARRRACARAGRHSRATCRSSQAGWATNVGNWRRRRSSSAAASPRGNFPSIWTSWPCPSLAPAAIRSRPRPGDVVLGLEHDIRRGGRVPARPHAGERAAEVHGRVHPGEQPGRTRSSRSGGDPLQLRPPAGRLAFRALPGLSRARSTATSKPLASRRGPPGRATRLCTP